MINPFEHLDSRLETIESLLLELTLQRQSQNVLKTDEDSILDINEASAYIKLSIPSIYRITGEGKMPMIKKGKKLLFSKKALTEWLMEGRKKTLKEIQKEGAADSLE